MKRLVNYFLQGLLYIAPLGITAYIIYVIFNFIDNLLHDKLEEIFKIDVPGLGFAVIFLFLVLVGIIGQSIFARPFKVLFKRIIEKAPLLKLIFSALNDLFSAFVGKEKKFNKPVMVLVNPISNLEKLGFLTEEDLSILDEKEKVAVYFPHSYNFSGELFIVPRNQVRVIDVNPSVVMKFIISGGVSGIYEERETVNDIE
ncbi:putative membrane protein [Arenibacter algicola]|uniref:Membrane protein n=1 Tax=Arenibacter algicola TaxID=616991 RepID=A0ABY3A654_9FLAO